MVFAFFLSTKKGKGVTVLSTIRMNFATGWLLPVGRMMEWQGYTRSGRPIFTRCSCCLWWWWKSRWTRNRIGWGGYAQWWWGWWERWWWSCWWWWRWSGYAESCKNLHRPKKIYTDISVGSMTNMRYASSPHRNWWTYGCVTSSLPPMTSRSDEQ